MVVAQHFADVRAAVRETTIVATKAAPHMPSPNSSCRRLAEERRDGGADFLDRVERLAAARLADRRGGRDQHRGHDDLGDDRADRGVDPLRADVGRLSLFSTTADCW